jgi:hypothetical protein
LPVAAHWAALSACPHAFSWRDLFRNSRWLDDILPGSGIILSAAPFAGFGVGLVRCVR